MMTLNKLRILRELEAGKASGYGIRSTTGMSCGVIYPILHELLGLGFIDKTKSCFELNNNGKEYLERIRHEFFQLMVPKGFKVVVLEDDARHNS